MYKRPLPSPPNFQSTLKLALVSKQARATILHTHHTCFPQEHMVAFMKRQGYSTYNYQRLFHLPPTNLDPEFDVSIFKGGDGPYTKRVGDDRIADPRLTNDVDFGTIFAPK